MDTSGTVTNQPPAIARGVANPHHSARRAAHGHDEPAAVKRLREAHSRERIDSGGWDDG